MKARILDDLAQMAGGTMSVFSGLREQIKSEIKSRVDEMAERLDLVPRADFDALQDMLKESRLKQEDILKRLEALEKKPAAKPVKKAAKKA